MTHIGLVLRNLDYCDMCGFDFTNPDDCVCDCNCHTKVFNNEKLNFVLEDFRTLLPIDEKIQTFIIDPPYNVKYNYNRTKNNKKYDRNSTDNFTKEEYEQFNKDLLDLSYFNSKDNASLFLINTPKNILELYETIKNSRWEFNQIIHWIYPNNMGRSKYRFTPCTRYIVWLVKKDYKCYVEKLWQPYKEDSKKTRAMKARGRLGANLYDWWEINLVKNVSKEKVNYVNQIPQELIKRLIIATTDENDLVGDLNCGTGSTLKVAQELNRRGFGCDINEELIDLWVDILNKPMQDKLI